MAFDPIQEDCLRLILQSMSRQNIMPLDNAEFIQRQMDEYRQNPDSLVVSDQDRSFHLVAKAAELADYRIPFMADEEEAMRNDAQAEAYLREAVELDPKNWDAQRMLTAMCADSNDAYVSYLIDQRQAVADDIAAGIHAAGTPYEKEFASDLASRPYLRWLAALSSHAFICGQYTLAFNTAIELLDIDPLDFAGVRYTAYLALAKLECTVSDIKRLRARCARAESGPQAGRRRGERGQERQDAWSLIAQINVLYRQFDYEGASHVLRLLLRSYPHCAQALYYQAEFPEGLFGRVNVEPGSGDELVLAISEATPLLQEGVGAPDCAGFSSWLSNHTLVQEALEAEDQQLRASLRDQPAKGEN